jgi:hypothetical protein
MVQFSDGNEKNLMFATAATAPITYVGNLSNNQLNDTEVTTESEIFNLQLAYWVRAKLAYREIMKSERQQKDLMALVITDLCLSLATLAGVQCKGKNIPDLITLWEEIMPVNGYFLKTNHNNLLEVLKEMNIIYENIGKHFSSYNKREFLVSQYLSKETLKKHFDNTRQIWLWFLGEFHKKKGINSIPEDQLKEFDESK